MSKPIIISQSCAANAVASKDFLEQDGAGAMKAFDGTGSPSGIAVSDKDSENRVGMIKQGLIKINAEIGTYNPGDAVEATATQTVQALALGTQIGTVAEESQKVLSAVGELLVYVNLN